MEKENVNIVATHQKTKKWNLSKFHELGKRQPLLKRVQSFYSFIEDLKNINEYTYQRLVISPMDREVIVKDLYTGDHHKMLMFASNNYLGLANHPYVKKKVNEALHNYGVGIGGPPLLNGYSILMAELEQRLADLKQQESAMIFSTGFSTNLGLLAALVEEDDLVLHDELSHASFYDGLRLAQVKAISFKHNNLEDLEEKLKLNSKNRKGEIFIGIEGVYSMDGDLAPLDRMLPLIKKYKAICLLDDAHGTGVLGKRGSGTSEHFGLCKDIDIAMGTFSKSFGMTGGFLAASKEVINYIRYFARPYVFSASLPPTTLAAVLAGIDVIEKEPWRREMLMQNVQYATQQLRPFGLVREPEAAIIALSVPQTMNLRKANYQFHQKGIFLNAIEYPAVPMDQQRFRISIMAEHTKKDIDQLVESIEQVWKDKSLRENL